MTTTDDSASRMDPSKMSGMELLRMFRDAPSHRPNIGALLGMRMDVIEPGHVTFRIDPRPDFANPLGTLHGGIHATILDSAMACAVHSQLEAGVGYGTLEMKLNFIRTVPTDAGTLTASGRVVHLGRTTAVAEGRLEDAEGRLVATGTETCIIYR